MQLDVFHRYSVTEIESGVTGGTEWHVSSLSCPEVGSFFELHNGATNMMGFVRKTATRVDVYYDGDDTSRAVQRVTHTINIANS